MASKKFVFAIAHVTSSPMEVIGILMIAINMKAYDDDAEIVVFLLGEGVQLAKKGLADSISLEMEGQQVNLGELLRAGIDSGLKFYVCHAFMPGFGVIPENMVDGVAVKASAYFGELLLEGYVPFSISI